MLEVADYGELPEHKPAFHGILIDEIGNTWVRAYPDYIGGRPDLFGYGAPGYSRIADRGPETWTVFSVEGEWLGDMTLPHGFRLLNAYEDRVIGIARDSLDVESVLVVPLEKAS